MNKATKELYIEYLKQEMSENEEMHHDDNLKHAIYMIDNIIIGGDFYDGVRCNDHNCLLEINYSNNSRHITLNGERYAITWEDVLIWGHVLVPETKTYTSDFNINELDKIGYDRLPLNNNHISGYKG